MTFLLFGFGLFFASGCKPQPHIVGGPCEYATYHGTATLIKKENGLDHFLFATNEPYLEQHARLKNNVFREVANKSLKTNAKYKATLKAITKGTCTPFILSIGR